MIRPLAVALLLISLPALSQQPPASGTSVDVRAGAAERPAGIPDIEVAYRAFVSGDLDVAERMLTILVERRPSPAAFLLRGCTRYTRAMLVRNPGALFQTARDDVRRAFSLNPSMWLDPRQFSPRLIAFVEEVRQAPEE